MIYAICFDSSRFQEITCTAEVDGTKSRVISDRWKGVGGNDAWFRMTGIGSPANELEVRERLVNLVEEYPGDLAFWLPPRELADVVPILYMPPMLALNQTLKNKAPHLLRRMENNGILIEYPGSLSEFFIRNWLESPKTERQWPRLKELNERAVEIEIHGCKYLVSSPSNFGDYRVEVFYCMNWQHDIVDLQLSKGSWKNWEADSVKARYYKIAAGDKIVFKHMPSTGTLLFRVPEKSSQIYCTQEFKDEFEGNDLKGLVFTPMAVRSD